MTAAWLCLLAALSFSWSGTPELEAPGRRSYAEATPELLARRAKACRADLLEYRKGTSLELMDRLLVCMDHPDGGLRAEVLDILPDRRFWDRDDYETAVRPVMEQLARRFEKDPDWKVRLHAGQLRSWLSNARHWRDYASPAAQERRRQEDERAKRRHRRDSSHDNLQLVLLAAGAAIYLTVLALDWFRRRRR
jgi:hypothetical protein